MALGYRKDIDGLRALAIIPVVLFHAQVAGFSGGFVGVDVFFVISGFLITSLIQQEIEQKNFSYLHFWERRARRLLPAIIFVTAVTCVVAYQFLMPADLKYLSQSVAAIAAFSSNILFWLKSGYFAAPDGTIPLLHTWSLAVEEQFYLLFPAVLLFAAAFAHRLRMAVIAAIAVASFALSVWWSHSYESAAYYLLPSRAWELMLGAALALHMAKQGPLPIGAKAADGLLLLGIGLVVYAVVGFDKSTAFPGVAALIPCVGAALIIWVGAQPASVLQRLFTNEPTVYIGKLSYSWYLWHWPVIVLWKAWSTKDIEDFGGLEIAAMLLGSLALAWISYRWVEEPVRRRRFFASRTGIFGASAVAVCAIAAFGVLGHVSNGYQHRLPAEIMVLLDQATKETTVHRCTDRTPSQVVEEGLCEIGVPGTQPSFVVWGDSHARALADVMSNAGMDVTRSGLHASLGACPPFLNIAPQGAEFLRICPGFNTSVAATIETVRPDVVFLAARWTAYGASGTTAYPLESQSPLVSLPEDKVEAFKFMLSNTIHFLEDLGAEVVLVEEVPYTGSFELSDFALNLWRGRTDPNSVGLTWDAYQDRHKRWEEIMSTEPMNRVHIVKTAEYLCDDSFCPVIEDGALMYYDSNHITTFGANHLRGPLAQALFDYTSPSSITSDVAAK